MRNELLSFVATRQDYMWFVGLIAWLAAGALWWRWARAERAWRWFPWSALAGVGVCAGELVMLASAVTPGPQAPAHLWGDGWLGLCMAVQLGGWWHAWTGYRRDYSWIWLPTFAIAAVRWKAPDIANLLLALGISFAGLAWCRELRLQGRGAMTAVVASWAASWISSHGVVADLLDQRRRWMEVSHVGVLGALCQVVAATIAVAVLAHLALLVWPVEVRAERVADARVFFRRGILWLLAGFAFSALAGEMAQSMFERSMLTRVHAMAMAVDTRALERSFGPEFRIEHTEEWRQPSGLITIFGVSEFQAGPAGEAVRKVLGQLLAANADVRMLRIRTFRDGQVLLGPGAPQPWLLTLEHPITEADEADWQRRVKDFRGMVYTSYDEVAQARSPLITPDDKMLGWLVMDVGVSSWVAAQTQARASAFAVVVLGLGVLALWCVQRWRDRERERAQAEAALAVAADRLKSSFLAKVSHELRTPLQSILGYGELARARAQDASQCHQLDALMQHGRLLIRLVNDLIDLSAVEAGGMRLLPEPVMLPDAFKMSVESLRPRAAAKGLDYVIETAGPAGTWIMADPERLRQIAFNLVGNAIKFTSRGRVTVLVRWECRSAGQVPVTFVVTDTGPGIAAEHRASLFKPFSRLATSARQEGAGLGLAITAGLCSQMGGSVTVESDGHTGSVFRATIILDAAQAPEGSGAAATVQLPGRTILIADDNALVRELFLEHLLQLGARCVAVADGQQAWDRIQHDTFDVLLLDLSMPGLDGLELARRIRGRPGPAPRLVAASAHAGPEHRAEAMAAGFDEFLVKPVSLERLARAVEAGFAPPVASLERVRERLREQFRREAPAQSAQLAIFVRERAWTEVRTLAHHLRNSAVAVDDPALAEALGPVERAAEAAHAAALDAAWLEALDRLAQWTPKDFQPISSDVGNGTATVQN